MGGEKQFKSGRMGFATSIFFRYELEHLIERSLFKRFEILGDYKGNRLNQDSKKFVVICFK
jgi:hypothetical protein